LERINLLQEPVSLLRDLVDQLGLIVRELEHLQHVAGVGGGGVELLDARLQLAEASHLLLRGIGVIPVFGRCAAALEVFYLSLVVSEVKDAPGANLGETGSRRACGSVHRGLPWCVVSSWHGCRRTCFRYRLVRMHESIRGRRGHWIVREEEQCSSDASMGSSPGRRKRGVGSPWCSIRAASYGRFVTNRSPRRCHRRIRRGWRTSWCRRRSVSSWRKRGGKSSARTHRKASG